MAQIRIDLNPAKLANPDLDIRYQIPERLAALPESTMFDDGYDYSNDEPPLLMVFLHSDSLEADVDKAIHFFSSNTLLDNCVLDAATILTSEDGHNWIQRYPRNL